MLNVYVLPSFGSKTAVGFDVSTASSFFGSETVTGFDLSLLDFPESRFRFYE